MNKKGIVHALGVPSINKTTFPSNNLKQTTSGLSVSPIVLKGEYGQSFIFSFKILRSRDMELSTLSNRLYTSFNT